MADTRSVKERKVTISSRELSELKEQHVLVLRQLTEQAKLQHENTRIQLEQSKTLQELVKQGNDNAQRVLAFAEKVETKICDLVNIIVTVRLIKASCFSSVTCLAIPTTVCLQSQAKESDERAARKGEVKGLDGPSVKLRCSTTEC